MQHKRKGFVLMACLAVIVLTAIVGLALLQFVTSTSVATRKRQYQDRGQGKIEMGAFVLKAAISYQLANNGFLDLNLLSTNQIQTAPSEQGGVYDLQLSAGQGVVYLSQTHNGLSLLNSSDDPFRGARASVIGFSLYARAQRLASGTGADPVMSLIAVPQVAIRQIPLSEFTLFADDEVDLSVTPFISQDIGRTYVRGNLDIVAGNVSASFPVAADGDVNLSSGGGLNSRSNPGDRAIPLPVVSTASEDWLSVAKSTNQSTILTGRDLPMNLIEPLPLSELTAGPSLPVASSEKDALRLWHQCSRIVTENAGKFTVQLASLKSVSSENNSYGLRSKTGYTTIILFDLSKHLGVGKSSFYIASTNPNAVVLVTNASVLPADLTIVTPHTILIAGSFNTIGTHHAASLITAQRVVSVPSNW